MWVVNCNLQRLDGPVRGNGKIIQELEGVFRGAGWNVIKVIWGEGWDDLLARDVDGVLLAKMNSTVDGEFQRYAVESGAYIREHFFGPDPRLRKLVEHLSDDELRALPRGGHDYKKIYAAYKAASENRGTPTVILAKTVKGWALGSAVEGRNATHQIKKLNLEQLKDLRRRLHLDDEIPDSVFDGEDPPYYRPPSRLARVPLPDGPPPGARRRRCPAAPPRCAGRSPCPSPRCSRSSPPARAARPSPPPWPSPACCATWPGRRSSAPGWCRSSPTRPAPSAWTRSSGSSRSTPPTASTTSRSTRRCCSPTPRARTARSSRRASPRPAPWPASPPPARATPPAACRWCRSSSSIRCSASSGSATSSGPRPTPRPRAS